MSSPITETTGTDCLLVVDANEADVRALGMMVGKLGFEVLPAVNGTQAQKALAARRPDLILLNANLPDMDGFAFCRKIQEHPEWSDIPVIFLSENNDKAMVVRALESGAVDYIIKPFHKQELLSRVRTHLMLRTSRNYARRLAQDKDELLGMISHHLQNHLVGMHMSAQFLLDRAQTSADPKLKLLAENIRGSSSQMRTFVKALLANSAFDHGLNIKLEAICLSDAARDMIRQYADIAASKGITLRAEIAGNEVMAWADASGLGQVLDNLISNAIKFSPPGGEVIIGVRSVSGRAEFSVRDCGEGFSEADKAKMFMRYARLSSRPTGGEPSTGLGLSIVKKLARAMGAELICESEVKKGTTFIVRLASTTSRNLSAEAQRQMASA
jgi:two-component system sensor histidine kinase/response regulator